MKSISLPTSCNYVEHEIFEYECVKTIYIELCATLRCYCSLTLVLQCCHRAFMSTAPTPLAPSSLGRSESPDLRLK